MKLHGVAYSTEMHRPHRVTSFTMIHENTLSLPVLLTLEIDVNTFSMFKAYLGKFRMQQDVNMILRPIQLKLAMYVTVVL